jgi:LPPG:FO 2-phospho-L-lactate transferase
VMYTLAGLSHPEQGWGLDGETFQALALIERYGGPAWFRLGDRDLATHLMRTEALAAGRTLTRVTADLCSALGVGPRILPMADAPRPTIVETDEGTLGFQEWLVRRRAAPVVTAVWSDGPPEPTPQVLAAIADADVVIVGPSNPYVSIDPILGLDGVRAALADKRVIAVSPIVAGAAVKGPLATMIPQLASRPASASAMAAHYGELLSGFVLEKGDAAPAWLSCLETATVMRDRADRARLASEIVEFAAKARRRE